MGRFSLEVKKENQYNRFFNILFSKKIAKYLFLNPSFSFSIKEKLKENNFYCCLLKYNNNDIGIGGISIFNNINKGLIDVGILPEYRGRIAKICCKEALNIFFDKYNDIQLFSFVKEHNKKSLYFSLSLGFKIYHKYNKDYILTLKGDENVL